MVLAGCASAGRSGEPDTTAPVTVSSTAASASSAPPSSKIRDIVTTQVTDQIQQAQTSRALPAEQATVLLDRLTIAVTAVRAGTALPADLSPQLSALFSPTTLTSLRTEDAVDPRQVAATLPTDLPVLLSCSDADIQIACADVEQVAAAASAAGASVTLSHLTDGAHTLKVYPSRTAEHDGDGLPFVRLPDALTAWTTTFATN
jgi:hypothetical protein